MEEINKCNTILYLRRYLVTSVILLTLFLFLQTKHEYWGDEAQAFLIARDSNNLNELFQLVRYEATPPLWHLLIFSSLKIFNSIAILKMLNAILYVALMTVVYLIRRHQLLICKLLFLSSYFIFFEWGQINRSYLLGTVLVLAAVYCLDKKKNYVYFFLFAGLGILANGHSFIIVISLIAANVLCNFTDLKRNKKYYIGLALFLPFLIWAFSYIKGKEDGLEKSSVLKANLTLLPEKVRISLSNVGEGILFIQRIVNDDQPVWQNNLLRNAYTQKSIEGWLISDILFVTIGLICLGISLFLLHQSKEAFLFILFSFSFMIVANLLSPFGLSLRHKAFYFLAIFIALLIAETKAYRLFILPLLGISTFSTILIIYQVLLKPFSNSKACAQYLQSKIINEDSAIKISGHFWQITPILAYTNLPIAYVPSVNKWMSYTKLDSTVAKNWAVSLNDTSFIKMSLHQDCNIIMEKNRKDFLYQQYNYKLDTFFAEKTIQHYERYYIYRKNYK